MAEGMHNIDIKDFTTVSSVDNYDHVVLSLFGGASAKISVSLLRSVLVRGIIPSISQDGVWYIGEETTNVTAEGKTAVFRKGVTGVEWKYTYEEDSSWRVLILYSDLKLNYDDLTDDQREAIRLKYSDLTDEEIAELQQPANEIKEKLEALETALKEAEGSRVKSEQERMEAETERTEAESKRKESELERIEAESSRRKSEEERILNEAQRDNAEKDRENAEDARQEGEESRIADEQKRISAESDRETAEEARVLNEKTRLVNESSRVLAEEARAEDFSKLKSESIAAVEDAQDTADHPTYIGEDNYVYKWDKNTKTYNKTSVYVRGEGFSISKVYSSVTDMESDKAHGLKEGDFVLINTGDVENPDNAQIYVVGKNGGFSFLVDMSGAIGFTGKTPQFIIGSVSTGNGKNASSVTLSSEGVDANGNPKYSINYIIPCLAYEDFTEDQIADLQKPASEMISKLQKTDDAVMEAERVREQAESGRVLSEQSRVSSESDRIEAESQRTLAEQERSDSERMRKESEETRVASENDRSEAELLRDAAEGLRLQSEQERKDEEGIRKKNETDRQLSESFRVNTEKTREASEEVRLSNEEIRIVSENTRVLSENQRVSAEKVREESELGRSMAESNRMSDYEIIRKDAIDATTKANDAAEIARNIPKVQNGTWWVFDPQSMQYVDTGFAVSSDYQLTKEKVENVLTGDIKSHTHSNLLYIGRVYDEEPDFTSLDKWEDEFGEHPFHVGNDIYVKDDSEPTGYANYKMAYSASGNVWVRIPQVPDGWRIILVKQ